MELDKYVHFHHQHLYVAVELLAMIIRNSKNYGTALPPNKNEATGLKKNKRMADDAKLFLHNKVNMVEAENIINTFSLLFDLRLHAKKTKAMKLGSKKKRQRRSKPSIQDGL